MGQDFSDKQYQSCIRRLVPCDIHQKIHKTPFIFQIKDAFLMERYLKILLSFRYDKYLKLPYVSLKIFLVF